MTAQHRKPHKRDTPPRQRPPRTPAVPMDFMGRATLVTETPTNRSIPGIVLFLESPMAKTELKELIKERLVKRDHKYRSIVEENSSWRELPLSQIFLEAHIKAHQLPENAGDIDLMTALGEFSGRPLPTDRPMWQAILIPHYKGGSVVVIRQHHCLGDGASIVGAMLRLSDDFDDRAQPPPTHPLLSLLLTIQRLVILVVCLPLVILKVLQLLISGDSGSGPLRPSGGLTGARYVAVSKPFDLAALRKASRTAKCTLNDMSLLVTTLAIRDILIASGQSPDGPMWSSIPMNLRGPTEQYAGNKFAFAACRLPVHLSDPVAALAYLRGEMNIVKKCHTAWVMYCLTWCISFLPSWVLKIALGATAGKISAVCSNVPCGQHTVVLNGRRVLGLYGLVPPPPGVSLAMGIGSYRGQVVFTAVLDRGCNLNPARLIRTIERELGRFGVAPMDDQPPLPRPITPLMQ